MYQFAKHFTLEEARALLPTLRQRFQEIHRHKTALEQANEEVLKRMERSGGDLGGPAVSRLIHAMLDLRDALLQVTRLGVLIKDLDRGLVDFPSLRDGREVFLCWELEEEDIEFWHELESGYAGRERL